jgi:hypothetical protein
MTTGAVVGVVRVGEPDAICGKVICGQVRHVPRPASPVRRSAHPAARRGGSRQRPSRRARSPGRLADDEDGSEEPADADAVLRLVSPGRTAIINLRPYQRVALADAEGVLAVSLLSHLLAVRPALGLHGDFPFTPDFVVRLAKRAGVEVGRNASRRVVSRLAEAEVLIAAGSYRAAYLLLQPSGFRVPLWRVGPAAHVPGLRSSAKPLKRLRSATDQASVAGPRQVKRWWRDPLTGNPDGRPPPCVPRDVRNRWASASHLREEKRREKRFYEGSAA